MECMYVLSSWLFVCICEKCIYSDQLLEVVRTRVYALKDKQNTSESVS